MDGKKRFSELQRAIPGITQRMLSKQLRELEACGLIRRTVYPVVPPMVEYELTEIGKSLEDVFNAIHKWGLKYVEAMSINALECQEENSS